MKNKDTFFRNYITMIVIAASSDFGNIKILTFFVACFHTDLIHICFETVSKQFYEYLFNNQNRKMILQLKQFQAYIIIPEINSI